MLLFPLINETTGGDMMKNKKWLALLFVFLLGACSDKEPSGPEARAGGSKTRETVVDSEQSKPTSKMSKMVISRTKTKTHKRIHH